MTNVIRTLTLLLVLFMLGTPSLAADQSEFERIRDLGMSDLTEEAFEVLEKKYPNENWDAYRFPRYVFTNDSVEAGYMIAVKEPDLLRQFKCYCFCDAMDHEHLLHCFVKDSERRRIQFDPHGAGCNICYGQAMMALLWQEKGFTQEQMQTGFEKRFERLIEQFGSN
ncbi:PCYCGC motif-containing (lipo)protein [Geoalkalibacter halelectricus]|uniref:Uncharacterized protein n=1 Tax=Geoalkalibacter halelectricus TaxID=2847045 RepID=A0ABY5ZPL4_9BACT|nr:PCYCGC motif-containing (lipo)protein [Geoalkalibacter halelectricus]MDO3379900.1 hypothetical protein [Geoalkalibacter halelectricus]UWZ80573.1 hypothetical protein L9S41_04025 [Geoalkalibacter halelectricus]